jgi:hypothetical protein
VLFNELLGVSVSKSTICSLSGSENAHSTQRLESGASGHQARYSTARYGEIWNGKEWYSLVSPATNCSYIPILT